MKKRSTTQNILYLIALWEQAHLEGKDLFIMFVDLRKAFDSVNRKVAYKFLEARGFPKEWVLWIKKLSEAIVAQLVFGRELSEKIPILSGFPRTTTCSPITSVIAVQPLRDIVRGSSPSICHRMS